MAQGEAEDRWRTCSLTTVEDGSSAVLDVNGSKQSLVKLVRGGTVKVARQIVKADPLIGAPYGTQFRLADGKALVRCDSALAASAVWAAAEAVVGEDNSQLLDAGPANQRLSAADIKALKASGAEGKDIIEALAAGSATYNTKTQFSQEKYRKRKAAKYTATVTVARPSARAVAELYFHKSLRAIQGLRADTLALLLALANVGPHADVLLLDACGGLVTGAVAERLWGHGLIVSAHTGAKPFPGEVLRYLNLPQAAVDAVTVQPLSQLQAWAQQAQPAQHSAGQAAREGPSSGPSSSAAAGNAPAQPVAPASLPNGVPRSGTAAAAASGVPGTGAGGASLPDGSTPPAQGLAGPCEPQGAEAASQLGASHSGAGTERGGPEPAQGTAGEDEPMEEGEEGGDAGGQGMEEAGPQGGGDSAQPGGPQQTGKQARKARRKAKWLAQRSDEPARAAKKQRFDSCQQQVQRACREGFSSCILAAPNLDPSTALQAVLPLLAPSASFAAFSNYLQPLAECMHGLQEGRQAVNLQLQESFWREHQVLPSRTHPLVKLSGTGGYLLSGTKVAA